MITPARRFISIRDILQNTGVVKSNDNDTDSIEKGQTGVNQKINLSKHLTKESRSNTKKKYLHFSPGKDDHHSKDNDVLSNISSIQSEGLSMSQLSSIPNQSQGNNFFIVKKSTVRGKQMQNKLSKFSSVMKTGGT